MVEVSRAKIARARKLKRGLSLYVPRSLRVCISVQQSATTWWESVGCRQVGVRALHISNITRGALSLECSRRGSLIQSRVSITPHLSKWVLGAPGKGDVGTGSYTTRFSLPTPP